MTKERIEIVRQSLIPFVRKELLEINFEGLGKSDAEEFEKDLNEILNLSIKALEQQPSEDVMAIHTQGLEEGIRCAMCTNSMKSDRGCDGGCVVNEDMYKKVMDTIKNQMFSRPTSDDCVSRQAVLNAITEIDGNINMDIYTNEVREIVKESPPVTPTHKVSKWIDGHCANCGCDVPAYINNWKWEKDMNAKWCPQCGADMRGSEDGSN